MTSRYINLMENYIYTQEFLDLYEDIKSRFVGLDLLKDQKGMATKIIDGYRLLKPKISPVWVKAFLTRNRNCLANRSFLSRIGKIGPVYVKIYLNQVTQAVVRYRWNKVFKFDTTSIFINNGSIKTVAPIRTDHVSTDHCKMIGTCYFSSSYSIWEREIRKIQRKVFTIEVKEEVEKSDVFLSNNQNG